MRLKVLLIILVILLTTPSLTRAVTGPELVINDSLKQCRLNWPNHNEQLMEGWYTPTTYVSWEDWQSYCDSLGYEFQQNEKISVKTEEFTKKQKVLDNLNAVRLALLAILIYLFYRTLVRTKRKYFLFIVCSIATYFVLSTAFTLVSYHIKPTTCTFLGVPEMLFGSRSSCF